MTRRRIRRSPRPAPPEGRRLRLDPRRPEAAEPQPAAVADRLRRDPRAEKGQRLRRELQQAAPGPTRPRRDPRADRGQRLRPELRESTEAAQPRALAALPAQRVIEAAETWIAAVSLAGEPWPGAEAELLGAARRLAGAGGGTVLLRLGARGAAADAGAAGADRLVTADEAGPEEVLALLEAFPARHILFAEGLADGDLARRLAARLGERPAAGVLAFDGARAVLRGDGGRQDLFRPAPRVMLLARNRFDPWEGERCEARAVALPAVPAAAPFLPLVETIRRPATAVPLAEADLILSAGEGVTDWPAFHALAEALGAAEAGSRQVCDAGHLPRDRQVGASGTLVEARAYLAFGISGAPQHLQGVQRCRFVLAVNTDLHAAMVKRADLALIADAQQVMPALTRLLRGDAAEGGR